MASRKLAVGFLIVRMDYSRALVGAFRRGLEAQADVAGCFLDEVFVDTPTSPRGQAEDSLFQYLAGYPDVRTLIVPTREHLGWTYEQRQRFVMRTEQLPSPIRLIVGEAVPRASIPGPVRVPGQVPERSAGTAPRGLPRATPGQVRDPFPGRLLPFEGSSGDGARGADRHVAPRAAEHRPIHAAAARDAAREERRAGRFWPWRRGRFL